MLMKICFSLEKTCHRGLDLMTEIHRRVWNERAVNEYLGGEGTLPGFGWSLLLGNSILSAETVSV